MGLPIWRPPPDPPEEDNTRPIKRYRLSDPPSTSRNIPIVRPNSSSNRRRQTRERRRRLFNNLNNSIQLSYPYDSTNNLPPLSIPSFSPSSSSSSATENNNNNNNNNNSAHDNQGFFRSFLLGFSSQDQPATTSPSTTSTSDNPQIFVANSWQDAFEILEAGRRPPRQYTTQQEQQQQNTDSSDSNSTVEPPPTVTNRSRDHSPPTVRYLYYPLPNSTNNTEETTNDNNSLTFRLPSDEYPTRRDSDEYYSSLPSVFLPHSEYPTVSTNPHNTLLNTATSTAAATTATTPRNTNTPSTNISNDLCMVSRTYPLTPRLSYLMSNHFASGLLPTDDPRPTEFINAQPHYNQEYNNSNTRNMNRNIISLQANFLRNRDSMSRAFTPTATDLNNESEFYNTYNFFNYGGIRNNNDDDLHNNTLSSRNSNATTATAATAREQSLSAALARIRRRRRRNYINQLNRNNINQITNSNNDNFDDNQEASHRFSFGLSENTNSNNDSGPSWPSLRRYSLFPPTFSDRPPLPVRDEVIAENNRMISPAQAIPRRTQPEPVFPEDPPQFSMLSGLAAIRRRISRLSPPPPPPPPLSSSTPLSLYLRSSLLANNNNTNNNTTDDDDSSNNNNNNNNEDNNGERQSPESKIRELHEEIEFLEQQSLSLQNLIQILRPYYSTRQANSDEEGVNSSTTTDNNNNNSNNDNNNSRASGISTALSFLQNRQHHITLLLESKRNEVAQLNVQLNVDS